jgi:hypothetical protein
MKIFFVYLDKCSSKERHYAVDSLLVQYSKELGLFEPAAP